MTKSLTCKTRNLITWAIISEIPHGIWLKFANSEASVI